MSDFTVGEPVPPPPGESRGKYSELISKVRALEDGEAIPVTFESLGSAVRFYYATVNSFKKSGIRLQKRKEVIYLSKLVQP